MALVTLDHAVYVPKFDHETGQYRDENPFRKHSRRNQVIECRCKLGTHFTTYSKFADHIKTKTHRNFIESYETYYKDADEFKKEIKGLKVENELLKRKLQKCEGIIQVHKHYISSLEQHISMSFMNGIEETEGPEEDVFVDAVERYT